MTNEEIDNAIAVLQAYKEGKTIESRQDGAWVELSHIPLFNFSIDHYRIKPEPHYRPFQSAEEVLAAIKEHGDYVRIKDATALERNTVIIDWDYMSVHAMGHRYQFEEALKEFDFSDGTPFGIKED